MKPEPAKPEASGPRSSAAEPPRPTSPRSAPPPSRTSAAPPPREGAGVLGLALAALFGAAIAVAVVAAFGSSFIRAPQPDMSRVAAVEGKLDAVGRDLAALRGAVSNSAQVADTSAIDARLGEMSKSIEASGGRVQGVETELRALAEQVGKPPAADPALGILAGRIDGLELRLQEAPTADALSVLTGRIAGVESRTADLPSKETLTNLGARVDAVGQKIEGATAPLASRVDGVSNRFDQLSAELKARPRGDPQARLVVALGALDRALETGRPFAPELGAATAALGENAELKPLEPYATSGVPTRAQLGARLSATLSKLAAPQAAQPASVFDRFVASAGGVVKVTPKGGAAGDDPAALRSQVQAVAETGDIESALAARGKLDEAARAGTEEWAALATARVSAENALNAARTAALARLSAND